jgi:hypothetical protein
MISDGLKAKLLKFSNNMCMNGMNMIPKPMMQVNNGYGGQYNNYYPNNIWGPSMMQGKQNGYINNGMPYNQMNGLYNNSQMNNNPYMNSNSNCNNVQRKSSSNSGTSSNTMENSNPNLQNYDEKKGQISGGNINGKYTCRFEMQIENDKDFQVARRLIGAKGCNMKKIVEMCGKNQDGTITQDVVKLRLRGKGSGYKEGPFNRESDEPLHLCISSKFPERYKYACNLVQELVYSVYEEYKKYCTKTNKIPVTYLAIRKEEGMSNRKKAEFDM